MHRFYSEVKGVTLFKGCSLTDPIIKCLSCRECSRASHNLSSSERLVEFTTQRSLIFNRLKQLSLDTGWKLRCHGALTIAYE